MIVCVTGWFDVLDGYGFKTGKKQFLVSHGVDIDTGKTVVLPCEHPEDIGAALDEDLNEYVLYD